MPRGAQIVALFLLIGEILPFDPLDIANKKNDKKRP